MPQPKPQPSTPLLLVPSNFTAIIKPTFTTTTEGRIVCQCCIYCHCCLITSNAWLHHQHPTPMKLSNYTLLPLISIKCHCHFNHHPESWDSTAANGTAIIPSLLGDLCNCIFQYHQHNNIIYFCKTFSKLQMIHATIHHLSLSQASWSCTRGIAGIAGNKG